ASSRKDSLQSQKEEAISRLEQLKNELQEINETVEQLSKAKLQGETEKDVLREKSAQKRSELAVLQEQVGQLQIAAADFALKRTNAKQRVDTISQVIQWLENDGANGPTDSEIDETLRSW